MKQIDIDSLHFRKVFIYTPSICETREEMVVLAKEIEEKAKESEDKIRRDAINNILDKILFESAITFKHDAFDKLVDIVEKYKIK